MKSDVPDSLWLHRARTGYSALVKVRDFSRRYQEIRGKFDDATDYNVDISVDDVKVQTPVQLIDQAIQETIARDVPSRGPVRPSIASTDTSANGNLPEPPAAPFPSNSFTPTQFHYPFPTAALSDAPEPNSAASSAAAAVVAAIQATQRMRSPLESKHLATSEVEELRSTLKRKGLEDVPKFSELVAPLLALKRKQKIALNHGGVQSNKLTEECLAFEIGARTNGQFAAISDPNEIVLRVAIFHPKNGSKSQEFFVLGSQVLSDLADRIYCVNGCSQDAEMTPGSCFFIEDDAFDDTRQHKIRVGQPRVNPADIATLGTFVPAEEETPSSEPEIAARVVRYSEPVVNWCNKVQTHHTNFKCHSMEKSTFNDLTLRLGSYYAFSHQGDCTHAVMFTELRIFNGNDNPNALAYPLRCFEGKIKRQKCRVCDLLPATAVTFGDKLSSEEPCYFCEECYQLLHYSAPDTLLYDDFRVYDYVHD